MGKPLDAYRFRRVHCVHRGNAVMGCGVQAVRAGCGGEELPRPGPGPGLLFTADCMLDNRRALLPLLAPGEGDIPDGELLFRAWRAWGRDCASRLLGSFSFAAYDEGENTLLLSADHVAGRSLYYCRRGSRVYFATTIHPISDVLEPPPELNLRWMSDYLSIAGLPVVTEAVETPFSGICKVEPGQYISFREDGEERVTYWDPLRLPERRGGGDGDYREEFLSLMARAAGEMADYGVQMGIYLSGGLDSSAVAAVTAIEAAGRGRELYSYTSVPFPGYVSNRPPYFIPDETENVQALCRMYPSIRPRFCPLEETDAAQSAPRLLRVLEIPAKSVSNLSWMLGIAGQAGAEGCRILLGGQLGNLTISWGNTRLTAADCFLHGHPVQALRLLDSYGRRLSISRKRLLAGLWEDVFPGKREEAPDISAKSFVDRAFALSQGSGRRIGEAGLYPGAPGARTMEESRQVRFNREILSLTGELETKLGLASGLVLRDITRDKRIYEFCLTAPLSCFVRVGRERRMLRDYAGGLLPPEIREDEARRGLQSADWVERLLRRWPQVHGLLEETCLSRELSPYVDGEKVRLALESFRETVPQREGVALQSLFFLHMAGLFLRDFPGGGTA